MTRTRPLLTLATVVAVACVVLSGCSDDGGTVSASRQSAERGTAAETSTPTPTGPLELPEATGEYGQYCSVAEELSSQSVDLDEDPAEVLDLLADAAELAPPEMEGDFAVLIDVVERLSSLEEDDPAAFAQVFELMFDPSTMQSMAAIDAFTMAECGFALDAAGPALPGD